MEEFFLMREKLYVDWKDYLCWRIKRDLLILENKIKFISEVIEETLEIWNQQKKKIFQLLKDKKYLGWKEIQATVPEELFGGK